MSMTVEIPRDFTEENVSFAPLYFLLSAVFFIFGWWTVASRRIKNDGISGTSIKFYYILVASIFMKSLLLVLYSFYFHQLGINDTVMAEFYMDIIYSAEVVSVALVASLVWTSLTIFNSILSQQCSLTLKVIVILEVTKNICAIILGDMKLKPHWNIALVTVDVISCIVAATVLIRSCQSWQIRGYFDRYLIGLFCTCGILAMFYLLSTTIVVNILPKVFPVFRLHWVDEMLNELIALGSFVFIVNQLRPELINPYVSLQQITTDLKSTDVSCHL